MDSLRTRMAKQTISSRFRRLLAGASRVLLLLVILHGATFWLVTRSVKADIEQMLMGVGGEMMRYSDNTRQDAPRTFMLNGQNLKLSVGSTKDPLSVVLDEYETRCIKKDGGLSREFANAYRKGGHPLTDQQRRQGDAVLRQDGTGKGFVVCLDSGTKVIHWKEWIKRLSRFVKTGNMSEVGQLRYIYAQQNKKTTTFVTLWNDASLNVWSMFPTTGDAPGFDLADVPRPAHSRRLLSARELGHRQSIHVYGSTLMDGNKLFGFYRDSLPKQGWKLTNDPKRFSRPKHAPQVLLAERGNDMLQIVTGTNSKGNGFANILNLH